MDTFEDRIALLRAESARFTQYLQGLSAEVWSGPSACDQWCVQDVVAHLIGVAQLYADSITRGIAGDAAPPPGRPPAGQASASAVAERVAQHTIAMREQLGDQVFEVFQAAGDHLLEVLAGLAPEDRQKPCYHPGGFVAAQDFADLRLKEIAVHEWDIRSVLEPGAVMSAVAMPAIIRLIAGSTASGSLGWGFWSGTRLERPLRYRFDISGTVPYQLDIIVEGDAARQEEPSSAAADITFCGETESFVRLVYGRLALETALADGVFDVVGDRKHAMAFAQWFHGL